MEIIVLKINQYKEKDGIIDAISKEGKHTFLVRSLFDPKNKNAGLNNPLTIADVELGSNNGRYQYDVISTSIVLFTPVILQANLLHMASIMLINEVTNFLLSDDEKPEMFSDLKDTIHELKKNSNPLKVVIPYLAKILKISGYDFEVSECITCGSKKNIVTFSFNDGGFICGDCYTEDIPREFNRQQMLTIREAFLTKGAAITNSEVTDEELMFIIDKFFEFIFDSYGYRIKSFDLLK